MTKIVWYVVFACCLINVAPVFSQEYIKWMKLEEALEKGKTQKRKIVVDVYTNWCGWCKKMDATTFRDPYLAKYINDNFYPVRFNAEQQEDIKYNNKVFKFVRNGNSGYHELAVEMLRGNLSYPTTVFLDEDQKIIQPIPGYLDALKFEKIASYFAEDQHKRVPWNVYEQNYRRGNTNSMNVMNKQ